jgi:two-component system, cell cycle sensor histidine kinase and response regulator CckA
MDPETIDRIFEPFFTTKPLGEGAGLVLATVYGIVKKAGGSMEVFSRLARGSTFQVCLPVPEDVTPRSVGEPPTSAPGQYGTETILSIEDDASVRGVAQKILSHAGYEVLVAASGEEALSLLEASRCTRRRVGGWRSEVARRVHGG